MLLLLLVHVRSSCEPDDDSAVCDRFNCRLSLPSSSIFRASGDASLRLPKVGTAAGVVAAGAAIPPFFTLMTVAFLESKIGIREAVLMARPLKLEDGRGLEKLAGDGL